MHSSPEMCHTFASFHGPGTLQIRWSFSSPLSSQHQPHRKNEMEILWKTTLRCIRLKYISGHGHGHSPRRETFPRTCPICAQACSCSSAPSQGEDIPITQSPSKFDSSSLSPTPAPHHEVISTSSCAKSPTLASPLLVSGAEISPKL